MDNEKVVELRKLSQKFTYTSIQMHETIARNAGFSSTDHKYLGFFLQKGNLTAGELADLTGLTTGAVTGLIDRFEKKKLVKRQYDKNDRRKVIIEPDSRKIMNLFTPFYEEFQNATDNIISTFSDKEKEIINTYLLKSIELMQATSSKLKK
jgi:DNA-binding MarR family transcriptional regulator